MREFLLAFLTVFGAGIAAVFVVQKQALVFPFLFP